MKAAQRLTRYADNPFRFLCLDSKAQLHRQARSPSFGVLHLSPYAGRISAEYETCFTINETFLRDA
jgi:hypothetical protein